MCRRIMLAKCLLLLIVITPTRPDRERIRQRVANGSEQDPESDEDFPEPPAPLAPLPPLIPLAPVTPFVSLAPLEALALPAATIVPFEVQTAIFLQLNEMTGHYEYLGPLDAEQVPQNLVWEGQQFDGMTAYYGYLAPLDAEQVPQEHGSADGFHPLSDTESSELDSSDEVLLPTLSTQEAENQTEETSTEEHGSADGFHPLSDTESSELDSSDEVLLPTLSTQEAENQTEETSTEERNNEAQNQAHSGHPLTDNRHNNPTRRRNHSEDWIDSHLQCGSDLGREFCPCRSKRRRLASLTEESFDVHTEGGAPREDEPTAAGSTHHSSPLVAILLVLLLPTNTLST